MQAPSFSQSAFYSANSWGLYELGTQPNGRYITGCVTTREGIVSVYSERTFTLLRKVVDGKVFEATWRCGFSKRYLVTLCVRFAEGYL